jgi:hypothetical protein
VGELCAWRWCLHWFSTPGCATLQRVTRATLDQWKAFNRRVGNLTVSMAPSLSSTSYRPSTAAYAVDAGAAAIYLVATVEEARRMKADNPDVRTMGEDHGRRPEGFDFSNSPVAVSQGDLRGRTLVHRTSARTQGVVGATNATRVWAAGPVCASATARARRGSRPR